MGSSVNAVGTILNEDEWLLAMELGNFSCLPMAMKAAVELDVLQIIAAAGPGAQISPRKIVASIPGVSNPDAAVTLDRILRVLASHSVLSCAVSTDENGKPERLYGLTPLCKYLVQNQDGMSLAPLVVMNQDKVLMDCWHYLKDAVLEGCEPFTKAHGMNAFEYATRDQRYSGVFNRGMSGHSAMLMEKILDTYQGFKDLQELVDVGGGVGSTLNRIVSRYPHIKGTNFDMPNVVADAPHYPGVTHVGGNMFESVPSGQAIFMKWILHDWSDDLCVKLLKNCHKALPEGGKVIVVDTILPVAAETSPYARQGFHVDVLMLAYNPGGKERTEQDFKDIASAAGFAGGVEPICCVNGMWVMEFCK
uniref:TSA: Wollemia nobilis Ref_Wollemi_Transcript_12408_1558 transcribed RNA sequence n=1 Tax=Wollemia nobilis TaxID=56998 RepID=A0A0C9RLG0_9CONI